MDPTLIIMNGYGCDGDTSDHESLELEDAEFMQSFDKSNSDSSINSINNNSTIEFLCNENKLLKGDSFFKLRIKNCCNHIKVATYINYLPVKNVAFICY